MVDEEGTITAFSSTLMNFDQNGAHLTQSEEIVEENTNFESE